MAAGRCCPFKAARARAPRGEGAGLVGGGARRALHLQPRAGTEERRRGARVCAVVVVVPAQRGRSTARGGRAHRHGPAGGRRRGDEDRLAAAAGAARLGLGGGKWGGTGGREGAAARRPAVLPPLLLDSRGNFGCGSGAAFPQLMRLFPFLLFLRLLLIIIRFKSDVSVVPLRFVPPLPLRTAGQTSGSRRVPAAPPPSRPVSPAPTFILSARNHPEGQSRAGG